MQIPLHSDLARLYHISVLLKQLTTGRTDAPGFDNGRHLLLSLCQQCSPLFLSELEEKAFQIATTVIGVYIGVRVEKQQLSIAFDTSIADNAALHSDNNKSVARQI